ncbi:hypothetical protein [Candidatus Nitrospira salsa]
MANYILVERSVGQIIRSAVDIYVKHFWKIIGIYALPILPIQIFGLYAANTGHNWWHIFFLTLTFLLSFFVTGALTIFIGDLCLGRNPSVDHSYRRILDGLWARLLVTNLLVSVVIGIGFLFLLIPGVTFLTWFALTSSVVVLESGWGRDALKRSKILVSGHFWHVLGTLCAMICISYVFGLLIGFTQEFVTQVFGNSLLLASQSISVVALMIVQALFILVPVLIYFDLRIRKEGYNNQTLSTDLMH